MKTYDNCLERFAEYSQAFDKVLRAYGKHLLTYRELQEQIDDLRLIYQIER